MQPEGCDQCLNVQVEAGDGWCPSWLCLALVLFNILTAPSASLHVAPRWVVQLTYLEDRMAARGSSASLDATDLCTPGSGQP